MFQPKVSRSAVVRNTEGVHARAATLIAELARRFDAQIRLTKDGEQVEATEVLQILSLGAVPGATLVIEATGRQAEEAAEALARLIENGFEESTAETSGQEDTETTQA